MGKRVKPKKKSWTIWTGVIISALGSFLLYLQNAPAGILPPWVPFLAGGLVPLLGAVVIALKIQDRYYEAKANRTDGQELADQMNATHAKAAKANQTIGQYLADQTKAAKDAAKIGAGLLMALAFASCDRSAEADAAFATEGRCGETVIRTMRKGVPVQCTIYGCRFPTRMSTLFCDEVPK